MAHMLFGAVGGQTIEGWYKVYEPLSHLGTVLAYNRPGIGRSSKPTVPQTGDVMTNALRTLVRQASLEQPYVLVGHSFGGLIANLFARSFPAEVAGAVFLDTTAPEDVAAMAAHETAVQRLLKRGMDAVFGKNALAESEHAFRTVEQIRQAEAFPVVPVAVVTGGKPAMAWATSPTALAARAEHQRRLAELSPQGRQLLAARSGHFPQFSEPELVVEAVRAVIAAAKQQPVQPHQKSPE